MTLGTIAQLNHNLYGDEILKMFLSILFGSILGIEREIRGKPAGFRTLALICFGATVFTICSYLLGVVDNRDRIAANVITGVGFLGAGVIFRNNGSVSGITTAASIWVAAAIGMLIGLGEFVLAGAALVMALFVLYILDFIQIWLDDRFQHTEYRIVFKGNDKSPVLRHKMKDLKISLDTMKVSRSNQDIVFQMSVSGKENNLLKFNHWLLEQDFVHSFEW